MTAGSYSQTYSDDISGTETHTFTTTISGTGELTVNLFADTDHTSEKVEIDNFRVLAGKLLASDTFDGDPSSGWSLDDGYSGWMKIEEQISVKTFATGEANEDVMINILVETDGYGNKIQCSGGGCYIAIRRGRFQWIRPQQYRFI